MDSNQNMQQMNADTVTDTSENMQASQSQMTQGVPMGQPMYGQAPQGQMPQGAPMGQPMYGQAPQGQMPQGVPMGQPMYGQAPQGQMPQGAPMGQQMYGYSGYANNGYNPYKQPKASGNFSGNLKKVKNEFAAKFGKNGIGLYCLIGFVAVMLLIFGPFMNFASIHLNTKVDASEMLGYGYDDYDYDFDDYDFDDYDFDDDDDDDDFGFGGNNSKKKSSKLKIKASVGMNLFELSKLSGSVDRVFDKMDESKSEITEYLDFAESYLIRNLGDLEEEIGGKIKASSVREVFGSANLLLKGRVALLLTPYIILISGLGLFFFTIINKKIARIVFAAIPLLCILWLMLCSTHFFSIMGVGAWAIVLGSALGIVSAILDKPATN